MLVILIIYIDEIHFDGCVFVVLRRRKHMVYLGGSVLADIMKDREEFWYVVVCVSMSCFLRRHVQVSFGCR